MSWIDILIIALVCVAVFFAIRKIVKNRKEGAGCSCSSGCSGGCAGCGNQKKEQQETHRPSK